MTDFLEVFDRLCQIAGAVDEVKDKDKRREIADALGHVHNYLMDEAENRVIEVLVNFLRGVMRVGGSPRISMTYRGIIPFGAGKSPS